MTATTNAGDNSLSKKRKLPRAFEDQATSAKRKKLYVGPTQSDAARSNLSDSNTPQSSFAHSKMLRRDVPKGDTPLVGISHGTIVTAPIKGHTGKPATFFDLPAEIRNQIYELALVKRGEQLWPGQDKVPRTPIVRRFHRIYRATSEQSSVITLALLTVNSQIHNEAAPVLYSQPLHFSQVTTLDEFLGGIGSNVSLIKHVVLQKWHTCGFPVKETNKLFRVGNGSALKLNSFTIRTHGPAYNTTKELDAVRHCNNCDDTGDKLVMHSDMTKGLVKHRSLDLVKPVGGRIAMVYVQTWLPGTVGKVVEFEA